MEVGWYVRSDGRETIGPLTTELLATSIRTGRVPLTAAACAAGSDEWLPVLELAPFADAARELIPAPPPATRDWAPPRPAPRETSPPQPAARDTAPASRATGAVRDSAPPAPLGDATIEEARNAVPSQIVFQRAHDRTDTSPLTYREYVHLVTKGTSVSDADALLQAQLKLVQASLAHLPPGKLVNLAVFDVAFQGKPPAVAPLATLRWKDWPDPDRAAIGAAEAREPGGSSASVVELPDASPPSDDGANLLEEAPLSLVTRAGPRVSLDARPHDEDLIADLFDAMHELHFLADAIEAGDFCLRICLEKLSCEAGVVHVYQRDPREFIVTNVRGATASRLLLRRHRDTDPALASVMSRRRPVAIESAAGDGDQNESERCVPSHGMRRILLAPVMPVARFLGAIELFNPLNCQSFSTSDANALAYIAQHFADFIATHGVVTSHDRIRGRQDRLASARGHRSSLARA